MGNNDPVKRPYRGRLAPTPTGLMHLGHARTFLTAQRRAQAASGELLMRIEDLDFARCKEDFVDAALEDLAWVGLRWSGKAARQRDRIELYQAAWRRLRAKGALFPCSCSRKDVAEATQAPHGEGSEALYPGTCRHRDGTELAESEALLTNWRFRVPQGEAVEFVDGRCGPQRYVSGEHFGDFLVWRKDGIPSYELAVVVDDIDMGITEVVRGEDLLASTARQLLLYRALEALPPDFYHCELVKDAQGRRLAKRAGSAGLRELRSAGFDPSSLAAEV